MLLSYNNTAHISQKDIIATANSLKGYVEHLNYVSNLPNYDFFESSINLPFDADLVQYVHSMRDKLVTNKLKYVLDIGIGGSNLGTKAIYDALQGYYDIVEPDKFPKVLFADTNDSEYIYKLQKFIQKIKDPQEIIISAVSKSGNTLETIANLEILMTGVPHLKDRLVIITNFESELWLQAQHVGIKCLPIPDKVGGRYSVFSAVGLFPLMCAGFDFLELFEGAMEMRNKCIVPTPTKNPAVISAVALYLNYSDGKRINDTFVFHPELESLGKWYRQLMAESLGKKGIGITPTVSIGSSDLHSMLQLYLGGPKDKFFTFISSLGHEHSPKVSENPSMPLVVEELRGKSTQEIMDAIFKGVKIAYQKSDIPFVEIQLQSMSERSVGKFMQFKMIEMMYLGKLLKVDAFNQPNVESYKVETKKILQG